MENGGSRQDKDASTPAPSSRVRLEVAVLDDDQSPVSSTAAHRAHGEATRLTVLVVAGEADFRRYVRECLEDRLDLRLIDAATSVAAVALAAHDSPDLLIVDEPERDVIATLSQIRAIVVVDDLPTGAARWSGRVRLLSRPLSADLVVAEVGRLLY